MDNRSFTVSEITTALKNIIEPNFRSISVKGEISNLKRQSSGHIYFTLKDTQSQLSAAFFKGFQKNISKLPKDGDQVQAVGEISIYAPRGSYQLIVRELSLLGIGDLLLQFQQLKEKLEKKGWFLPETKKKLPLFPKTIGIITSPTGSVIRDIVHVLNRRFSNFHIRLCPVKVQGEGAKEEIAKAVEELNKYNLCDVIIIARGGGSLEDLWPFNEEVVASSVYHSTIPIISAVGHETDFTLCDFVADVRAPTPSAAAEIVIREKALQIDFLEKAKERTHSILKLLINNRSKLVKRLIDHPYLQTTSIINKQMQQVDEIKEEVCQQFTGLLSEKKNNLLVLEKGISSLQPKEKIKNLHHNLLRYKTRIEENCKLQISSKKRAFERADFSFRSERRISQKILSQKQILQRIESHIRGIDPKNLLQKGYSILFSKKNNSIISSANKAHPKEAFYAMLSDGTIHANIEKVELNKNG